MSIDADPADITNRLTSGICEWLVLRYGECLREDRYVVIGIIYAELLSIIREEQP